MAAATEEVIIIGSGPAGLTAALYAARADLEPLAIEGREAGGQLMLTTDVENYPGYPQGRLGPEMMNDLRMQAERFGTRYLTANVDAVDLTKGSPFRVTVGDVELWAQTVIVATGATARWLGLDNERRLTGRGVSSCATCDGFFFRDLELVVVGGGDSAMEEATFLTKFASKVYIVHRRDEFRASKIMAERALNNPKIEVKWNSIIDEVLGNDDDGVTAVRVRSTLEEQKTEELEASGYFAAIGHTPVVRLRRLVPAGGAVTELRDERLVVMLAQPARNRRCLDELRACTNDRKNLHSLR
jgi:thioredoxin reductase (NADPH)